MFNRHCFGCSVPLCRPLCLPTCLGSVRIKLDIVFGSCGFHGKLHVSMLLPKACACICVCVCACFCSISPLMPPCSHHTSSLFASEIQPALGDNCTLGFILWTVWSDGRTRGRGRAHAQISSWPLWLAYVGCPSPINTSNICTVDDTFWVASVEG